MTHWKRGFIAGILFLGIAVAAYIATDSGPHEDGLAAHDSGDYAPALRWWRPLGEQGYLGAQNNLGDMYRDGQGVAQDHAEAAKWFQMTDERQKDTEPECGRAPS